MLRRCLPVLAVALASAVLLGACGLIDSDIADVDLALPEKTFQIDTAQWNLDRADEVVAIACTPGEVPDRCAAAAVQLCEQGECEGACGSAGTCELTLHVVKVRAVDLVSEKPDLAEIQDSVLDVTIDAIRYQVTENSLDVATPPFTLHVGPQTGMAPGDAGVVAIGTIPTVQASTMVARTKVELTSAGKDELTERMGDFRTPFNLLVAGDIVLRAGDPVPSGKLVAQVSVDAHAGL
jgi:hypothetical protein